VSAHSAARPAGTDRARLASAVAAAPRDPELRRALAAALARAGEAAAALEQYRTVLALLPDDPDAAADAGLMAQRCGLQEEVLPLLHASAKVHPRHARLRQVLGLMHRALDELDPAIEAFESAAALAPNDALIAHGHARAALEAGRPARALFERALALAPADDGVVLGLVAAIVAEGDWRKAAGVLEARLRERPDWTAGHATLARLRWVVGDRQGYTSTLEQALATRPRDIQLWRELLANLVHAERFEEALAAVERGRAAAGGHILFDANEAICRGEMGELERADRLLKALDNLNDPTLAVRHIRVLLRSGRIAEAAAMAETGLSGPTPNVFWPYLASAWRLLGDERWQWLEGQPGLVEVYDLAPEIGAMDSLAERLRALHTAVGQPLDQSVRGGTQTDGNLFARSEPEIRVLRKAIVEAVRSHIAGLPPPDPRHPQLGCRRTPVRFSGAWSVRLVGEGHHSSHVHPAGWFSSAFYVALPDECDRGGGDAGWLTLGEPPAELGLDLAPFRQIEPKPGRLALFPSTMWHGTRPFRRGERLTVAFDVAFPP
jgi:tetratricopeptide (TPR) repeat protein